MMSKCRKGGLARWLFLLLTLVGLLFVLVAWNFGIPSRIPCFINPLIEQVTGETPEAKVVAYLEATRQGDEARRQAVIETISALGADLSFRVLDVEWWSNCCEPCVIDDPRRAGFARLRVAVGGATGDEIIYVFDVWVTGGPYYGEMMGCPVRHWEIIDAYPEGEEPLYWKWPREWEW